MLREQTGYLIEYLIKETGLKETDIRDFILLGDFMKDEDTAKDKRQGYGDMLISKDIYRIDNNGKVVVNRLKDIDNALANIRVADPAVGSGAFPLGMLNEIVRARQNISAYMAITMTGNEKRLMYNNERSPYSLKLETIKNCIFAADIEPSAVDIAQLRLWLSLVIDDEINPNAQTLLDGHKNPLPLPNLECNIVCGNSLVDEFEGIPLINHNSLIANNTYGAQQNFYQRTYDAVLPSLLKTQDELFRCEDTVKKQELKNTIESLKDELVKAQLDSAPPETWENYQLARRQASRPFVLWQIDFARVFRDKGGFDIVIGNPPYVDSEEMTKSMPDERKLYAKKFKCAKGNWDLFVLFIEKGFDLLKKNGVISYIVPNKLISAPYTVEIRKLMSQNNIQEIRDYSEVNVFKSAAVYPVVFRVQACEPKSSVVMDVMHDMNRVSNHNVIDRERYYKDIDWDKYFHSSQIDLEIIEKMNSFAKLGTIASVNGAATVNEAYLVKEFIYDGNNDTNDVKKFINTGGIDPYRSFHGETPIRYLKGCYKYPLVPISEIRNMSEKRYNESNSEKIIIGGMTKILECYYDSGKYLAGKSTTLVYGCEHLKYITAVLNSKLMTYFYRVFYNSMSLEGGFYRIGAPQVKTLPIAFPDNDNTIDEIENQVITIQKLMVEGDNETAEEIMHEIDELVYQIYGLSKEEIQSVEAKNI